jgi:phage shock protein A
MQVIDVNLNSVDRLGMLLAQIADLEEQANALAADMTSTDPAVRQRAALRFLNGPASSLATSAQGFVTLTEDFISSMKTAQATAEFQEKATDQEKAEVEAAIAQMESDLPKMRQAATDARASLEQAKAELAANPIRI